VVVRAIDSDLRVDYTAVGQTTHLAARMEQMERARTALSTAIGLYRAMDMTFWLRQAEVARAQAESGSG
jgi:class 3 adenylate cyclase